MKAAWEREESSLAKTRRWKDYEEYWTLTSFDLKKQLFCSKNNSSFSFHDLFFISLEEISPILFLSLTLSIQKDSHPKLR
jgi:hypothetical protein